MDQGRADHTNVIHFAYDYDFRKWRPTVKDFERAIDISNNSSPGPDGIPYGIWRVLKQHGAQLLHAAYLEIINSDDPKAIAERYPEFNESILVFLPKTATEKSEEGYDVHEADATRPLNITNTHNRLIANAVRLKIEPHVDRIITHIQCGFVGGRSMLANIFDI